MESNVVIGFFLRSGVNKNRGIINNAYQIAQSGPTILMCSYSLVFSPKRFSVSPPGHTNIKRNKINAIKGEFEKGGQYRGQFRKPILERKAIKNLKTARDPKSYRQWNQKLKNAMGQVRPGTRTAIKWLETEKIGWRMTRLTAQQKSA